MLASRILNWRKHLAASASDNMTTNKDDPGEEEQGVNATSQGRNTDKPADIHVQL